MRITKISLTNFRSFKSTQFIELAPVTLLFGPNSVGKSSVLMALAYVYQILAKGHCNPQKLDAWGSRSIGGFQALVHGKDLNQTIKIRLDYEAGNTPFFSYLSDVEDMANQMAQSYLEMMDFGGNIKNGAIELEIAWSTRHQHAYVKTYRAWINNHFVGAITSSEDLKTTQINELNTQHPLLIPTNNDEWLDFQFGESGDRRTIEDMEPQTELEDVIYRLNPNSRVNPALADIDNCGEKYINRTAPISLRCGCGALPVLGSPVQTNLDGQDFDALTTHFNFLVVREVLSQAFVLPLDKMLEYLNANIHIGPLRIVPNNDYVPNPHPEQKDWYDGSASWDLIYKDPNSDVVIRDLISDTNVWLSSKRKLNTGYKINNQSLAEQLGVDVSLHQNPENLLKRNLSFNELRTNISLSANQLGTGISQVLPIVVAANLDHECLVAIEQPELHIHPRFQVELGDLFLENSQKHTFLIETHSEHLVLRLLKRIREASELINPTNNTITSIDDIAIIYLEPSEDGVTSKRIRIDKDGEFKDRWPDGFFNERREELM